MRSLGIFIVNILLITALLVVSPLLYDWIHFVIYESSLLLYSSIGIGLVAEEYIKILSFSSTTLIAFACAIGIINGTVELLRKKDG